MTATIAIGLSLLLTGLGAWLAVAAVYALARADAEKAAPRATPHAPIQGVPEALPKAA